MEITRAHKVIVDKNSSEKEENPWEKIWDVMIESILVLLPMIDIFNHCKFVCKRWKAIIESKSFSVALGEALDRRPWICIYGHFSASFTIRDMMVLENYFPLKSIASKRHFVPFASPMGLMGFHLKGPLSTIYCSFTLPKWFLDVKGTRALAIHGESRSKYQAFMLYGIWPDLNMKTFTLEDENKNYWIEMPLEKSIVENKLNCHPDYDMPLKTGVTVRGSDGCVMVYYLTVRGRLICYDSRKCRIVVYPSLVDHKKIYGDLANCGGKLYAAALLEGFFQYHWTLSVWEFDSGKEEWKLISTVQPNMFQDYNDTGHVTLHCSGYGDYIVVCINFSSDRDHYYEVIIYDIKGKVWFDILQDFGTDRDMFLWPFCLGPVGAE